MFCKHEWKLISEVTTKSPVEHTKDIGLPIDSFKGDSFGILMRKYIQVFACNKCGKLEKFVEEI